MMRETGVSGGGGAFQQRLTGTCAGRAPSVSAWACLTFGLTALIRLSLEFTHVLKFVPGRTVSGEVEEVRKKIAVWLAFASGIVAVLAGTRFRPQGAPARSHYADQACLMFGLLAAILPVLTGLNRLAASLSPRGASGRRDQCVNNLKQIKLALEEYANHHGGLMPPPAITDRDGKPLLSWRVAILPYLGLEGQSLHLQFHLDEPWDSPYNRAFQSQIPTVYVCSSQARWTHGQTFYQVLIGPGTFFEGTKGVRPDDVPDGPASTIAVVEGPRPVPWTKPEDISFGHDQHSFV